MATVYTLHVGFSDAFGNDQHAAANRVRLFHVLDSGNFDGYTVLDSTGCYQGNREPGANVVFIARSDNEAAILEPKIREAAKLYKKLANQEEVWLTARQEILDII